jgi:hypothetical protein
MEQVEFMAIANWNLRRIFAAIRLALHPRRHPRIH